MAYITMPSLETSKGLERDGATADGLKYTNNRES